jgi:hypothetical protein
MTQVQDVRQNMNSVSMELGGKERVIQYDMNAFAELENRFGSVEEALKQLTSGRITDIRLILWTGLIHEEAVLDEITGEPIKYNITPYQVGSWLRNPAMMTSVTQKITEAMDFGSPNLEHLPDDAKKKLEDKGYVISATGTIEAKPEAKPEESPKNS